MSIRFETIYDLYTAVWDRYGVQVLWGPTQLWLDIADLMQHFGHQARTIYIPHSVSLLTWCHEMFQNGNRQPFDGVTVYALCYIVAVALTYELPIVPYPTAAAFLHACTSSSISSHHAYYVDRATVDDVRKIVTDATLEHWHRQTSAENDETLLREFVYLHRDWSVLFPELRTVNPVRLVLEYAKDPLNFHQVDRQRQNMYILMNTLQRQRRQEIDAETLTINMQRIDGYGISAPVRQVCSKDSSLALRVLEQLQIIKDAQAKRDMSNLMNALASTCNVNDTN